MRGTIIMKRMYLSLMTAVLCANVCSVHVHAEETEATEQPESIVYEQYRQDVIEDIAEDRIPEEADADVQAESEEEYGSSFQWTDPDTDVEYKCIHYGEKEAAVYGVSKAGMNLVIPENVSDGSAWLKVTRVIGYREATGNYLSGFNGFQYSPKYSDYELATVDFADSVEYIGEASFGSRFLVNGEEETPFKFLTGIALPQNPYLTIGQYAFKGCYLLQNIKFKTTVGDTPQPAAINSYAFQNCVNLKTITLPPGSTLYGSVFDGCWQLEEVNNVPSGLSYGLEADQECALKKVTFSPTAEKITGITVTKPVPVEGSPGTHFLQPVEIAGITELSIPANVKSVEGLSKLPNLRSVSLPEGLEEIGRETFRDDASLASINLPASVNYIGDYAFYGCRNLHMSVYHPQDSLYYQYAFSGITDITISPTANAIMLDAFLGCDSLRSITINNPQAGFKTIDGVLYSPLYNNSTHENIGDALMVYPPAKSNGGSYTIPSYAAAINSCAFYGTSFSEIHIPHDITYVFYGNSGLLSAGSSGWVITGPFDHMKTPCTIYYVDDIDVSSDNNVYTIKSRYPGYYLNSSGEEVYHTWKAEYIPVEGMTLKESQATVGVNHTIELTPVFTPSYASNQEITWTSSNTAIAAVDSEGVVTGKKAGTVIISAVSKEGGYKASCRVTVSASAPDSIKITNRVQTLRVMYYQIYLTELTPSDAALDQVTWTSSNPKIADIDENGKLIGRKVGKTTITARTENGKTDSLTVRVVFQDVHDSSLYYYNPVYWAVDKAITNGYTDEDGYARMFKPENNCTREAVVTFLWRLAGKPEPKSMTSKFKDVQDKSKYYYKAILWAAEKGITGGYSDGTFRPDDTCLREHVVTFLWRYAGKPAPSTSRNPFNDVNTTDYYYKAAVWANEKGIAKGYSTGEHAGGFGPKLDCLREHVVTFLYRYAK